ncbi:ribonuclease P protein component [Aminipila sp.]|jgi:ribonuclease P protein component|uniref:ribonuclease P protein component n=1 Tax=Aminipila sp. TaxID=2060095 RepID=UPI001DFB0F2A|nr:ribonuclease P protein component [Aminipila sp.]MBE6034342.1 ribonuclease P protein component [Clostridiales bacterium]
MLKKNVLRNKKDFSAIYNRGNSFGGKYVVIFCRRNNLGYNRLGFLASKKVGNSVVRNRARRLMKESFRNMKSELKEGFDIILIARNSIKDVKCNEVQKSMNFLLKKAGLIKNE